MNVQVLIATMHQSGQQLLEKMNVQTSAVVINQCDRSGFETFYRNGQKVDWVNSSERGLSRSRNAAIKRAGGDICLLADDDLIYKNGYEQLVAEQFRKYPDADIIAFQVNGIEETFKSYYPHVRKIGFLTSMKIASVEIAFRLESIQQAGVCFDELFGAGAPYFSGEENIFLHECLKRKLTIMYVPVVIADLHVGESTWFQGYNEQFFVSKGAVFARMTKKLSPLLILQFAIRKSKEFSPHANVRQSIRYMFKGRQHYFKEAKG